MRPTDNRIDKNLKMVGKNMLVVLPQDASFALDEFVSVQEKHVRAQTVIMEAKNVEVETAVHDLIALATDFQTDNPADAPTVEDIDAIKAHYNRLMYQALLTCTKNSLNALKNRVCARSGAGVFFAERPFFEVDVQLAVPSVRLSPSLDDIQRSVNKGAMAVLRVSKSMWDWGQRSIPEDQRLSLFMKIGMDLQIVKVCLLLTGALHGTKNTVFEYLGSFQKYDWLWKEDMEMMYKRFMERRPEIADCDAELQKFVAVEKEIETIVSMHVIGALSLNTRNLKLQLRNECRGWKVQYSGKVHQQARERLNNLTEYMRTSMVKLNREVDDLDKLRFVMGVLKEIRERESSIEMEVSPILDMYQMLESYLPGGYMDKDEMDQKSVIRSSWRKLVDFAEEVTDRLSGIQGKFKKQLMTDVKAFAVDVQQFRAVYVAKGPMVPGLKPREAVERLKKFKEDFEVRARKLEAFSAGEELFALRRTEYPELTKTKKELGLLDQLYGLYMDVVNTLEQYRNIAWRNCGDNLENMRVTVEAFDARCKKMPKNLRDWQAYQDLKTEISNFMQMLPLLQDLGKPSIQPRHWQAITKLTGGTKFAVESETFKFRSLLDAGLLRFKDEIMEICDSADKQQQIESKLSGIRTRWANESFNFAEWKARRVPVLKAYGAVIEALEESQLSLQGMMAMRHVTPFKDTVSMLLTQLSDTSDTLELWVKVQMLWTSLESVFTGGDIAKQMPLDAKKFMNVDKNWSKIMTKAAETGNVVQCCGTELLRNTLPILYGELEKCQKSLEGYLEQKRNKFPRFYFVSNPVLLQILSQGSDPLAMQAFYEKIFDSISRVVHNKADVRQVLTMRSIQGADMEEIVFAKPVKADGSVEDWLRDLETEMKRTMKVLCERAAAEAGTLPLREFVDKSCGQFALLGLQLTWTADCQDALTKCRVSKGVIQECNKKALSVLSELSSWCLSDLGSRMNRTKIETLVTMQMHLRDVWGELTRLYKERKISDPHDFEWLKQARAYWRPGEADASGPGVCAISICDTDNKYGFEYLGCKERLVITGLTDRAYITLTQALSFDLGGAPAGPAGTGKTETVKDLGRMFGLYVIVTNCSDQHRYSDMAKMFKGLCQAGLWGCFDEFNRIELPVLSVVAQQVLAITSAKRANALQLSFPGDSQVISLSRQVAYFITMNPGYQGRTELPENLKVRFVNVPTAAIFCAVLLCVCVSLGSQRTANSQPPPPPSLLHSLTPGLDAVPRRGHDGARPRGDHARQALLCWLRQLYRPVQEVFHAVPPLRGAAGKAAALRLWPPKHSCRAAHRGQGEARQPGAGRGDAHDVHAARHELIQARGR